MITPSFPVPCYGEINGELGNFYVDYVNYCKIAFLDFTIAHLNSQLAFAETFMSTTKLPFSLNLTLGYGCKVWYKRSQYYMVTTSFSLDVIFSFSP